MITEQYIGSSFFLELSSHPAIIGNISMGISKKDSETYYFDNNKRPPAYLFQYTLSGTGMLEMDGQTHILTRGQAFFLQIPGEEKYYFDPMQNEAPWHFMYIIFQGSGVAGYCQYILSHFGKLQELELDSSPIQSLMQMIYTAKSLKFSDYTLVEGMVFDFLCKLCHYSAYEQAQYSPVVKKAIAIMEDEFGTLEGIRQTAERLQVSSNHLSRIFLEQTGMSPIDYLIKIRLEKAAQLLTQTLLPVKIIAVQCGFSTSNYFSKAFRRYYGLPPTNFRQNSKRYLLK